MKAIKITLAFDGETEAVFNFYKSIFGGEFDHLQRMKEIPGNPLPAHEGEKILHMSYSIGSATLLGMDVPKGRMDVNKGNNFMITIDTDSEEETARFFKGLAEGGTIIMPLANQFWGAYFGMVTDKFGIQWMLSYVK